MTGSTPSNSNQSQPELGNGYLPCFRCGICCTKYQARLSPEEARRIADELNVALDECLERYADKKWPGTNSFLLRQSEGACVFLERVQGNKITSCLIEPFKPSSCKDWNPSIYRRECQEGLARYWGLRVSPAGQLMGTEQKLKKFQSFLGLLRTSTNSR